VKVWDIPTGKEQVLNGRTGYVYSVEFSPDGKTLAVGNVNGVVQLWDVETRNERTSLEVGAGVYCVAFAPDGKALASADMGGRVKLWDLVTGKEIRSLRVRGTRAYRVRYAPDGKRLVSVGFEGSVQLWDAHTGKELAAFDPAADQERAGCVQFAPTGKVVATGTVKGVLVLRDATTLDLKAAVTGHDRGITAVAFSPDGKLLATGGAVDRVVKLWDVTKLLERGKGDIDEEKDEEKRAS
jgi:WD40 repeat protein